MLGSIPCIFRRRFFSCGIFTGRFDELVQHSLAELGPTVALAIEPDGAGSCLGLSCLWTHLVELESVEAWTVGLVGS